MQATMPLEVIGGKLAGVGGLLYRPDLDFGGQPRPRVLFYDPLGVLVTDAVRFFAAPAATTGHGLQLLV